MNTKLQILDEIIKLEDQYESELANQVESKVTTEITNKFGDFGKQICDIYYKKVETDDVANKDPDCPTCDEKAKLLIKRLKLANTISESITNSDFDRIYDQIISELDENNLHCIIDDIESELSQNMSVSRTMIRNALIKWLVETIT